MKASVIIRKTALASGILLLMALSIVSIYATTQVVSDDRHFANFIRIMIATVAMFSLLFTSKLIAIGAYIEDDTEKSILLALVSFIAVIPTALTLLF
jgi:hypothetical protein